MNTKGRKILNQIDLRPCKKIADATPWRVCAHTMTNDSESLELNLIEPLVLEHWQLHFYRRPTQISWRISIREQSDFCLSPTENLSYSP